MFAQKKDPSSYPLKGFSFFVVNPPLWGLVICPIILIILFALLAVILLFALALVPQEKALHEKLPTWASWLIAVILVFVEIFIAVGLFMAIIFGQFEDRLFDRVLKILNKEITGRESFHKNFLATVTFFILQFMLQILTLPINIVPIVGTIGYCAINGFMNGWSLHMHYFELKGMSFTEQYRYVQTRKHEYTYFGGMACLLSSIPLVGFFLSFTNVVGAALWAIDVEEELIGTEVGKNG